MIFFTTYIHGVMRSVLLLLLLLLLFLLLFVVVVVVVVYMHIYTHHQCIVSSPTAQVTYSNQKTEVVSKR